MASKREALDLVSRQRTASRATACDEESFDALVQDAKRRLARLRTLVREAFPAHLAALTPFFATVESAVSTLGQPGLAEEAEHSLLLHQLSSAGEALVHLDALMEAFSMQPKSR